MASIFEAGMLICFGCSWPISLYKSIKAGTAKGKSIIFTVIIMLGYVSALIGKIITSVETKEALPYTFYLYILNLVIVSCDFVATLFNMRKDKMRALEAENAEQGE